MPFYKMSEMEELQVAAQPMGVFKRLAGELMKVGFVSYPKGKLSRPHFHPNEEQFVLMLEGKQIMILGEEEKFIEAGDLAHIPRNTKHGGIILEDVVMFTAKSPVGDGDLAQDHNDAEDAEEITHHLEGKFREYN